MVSALVLGILLVLQAPAPPAAPAKPKPAATAPAAKPEDEVRARGRQLLETAAAEAGGIREEGMRGYAFLQLARAYSTFDRPKALEFLDQAFTAAVSLPDDSKSKPRLEAQILQAMAAIDPQHAEDLAPQVAPEAREAAFQALLAYYQKQKQLDKALEVINRIASEGSFPFGAASDLMQAMPPEKSAERQQLFTAALNAFRDRKPTPGTVTFGGGDFPNLVLRYWRALPPQLVREAIDAILKDADPANQPAEVGDRVLSMSGPQGSLSFTSQYEYRLFQVLPVLRALDPSKADDLLKDHQALQAQMAKYPQGMDSWEGRDKDGKATNPGGASITGVTVGSNVRSGRTPPQVPAMMLLIEQMNKIAAELKDHPDNALTMALALPDDENNARLRTLLLIARATRKNNPSVCTSALSKALDQMDRADAMDQINFLDDAGRLYRDLKDTDAVKKVAERGVALAEKLYKQDTDADDPNKAVKAFWPSTSAWTSFIRLAADVSPDMALKLIGEIPDEEIRPTVRTSLAALWLDAPSGTDLIMRDTKKGTRTMTGRGNSQSTEETRRNP
jgi:hypothetical protein